MYLANSPGHPGRWATLGFMPKRLGLCYVSLEPALDFLIQPVLMHEFPERHGFERLNSIKLTL